MIYFPRADIGLVWLPSAQSQTPAHRLSYIYVAIITKVDLDQIVRLIYKGRSLQPDQKVTRDFNRLKTCWYKTLNHVKTHSKSKLWKNWCRDILKKESKGLIPWFGFLDVFPVGCSGPDWVIVCDPFQQQPLPATQTQSENMTSPLYHLLDTLEAQQFSRFKCSMQMEANGNSLKQEILRIISTFLKPFPQALACLTDAGSHYKGIVLRFGLRRMCVCVFFFFLPL